jgi:hypothetical protein
MVTMGILPYQGKIPMVEPGIEPGNHEAGPDENNVLNFTLTVTLMSFFLTVS